MSSYEGIVSLILIFFRRIKEITYAVLIPKTNFPADNEIIQKINERLSIRLNSGSKIRI